jgi:hypothetical protein
VYFKSQCTAFLKAVLDKARAGTLDPRWREELAVPAAAAAMHTYSESAALAI